jgi:cell division transport system ATP-binding protein
MIRYEKVSKVYPRGDVMAVDRVSWEVKEGDFVFLVGPSGAGKTTLLKFLIREDRPTEGEIWFNDTNIVKLPNWQVPQLRRKIGMVFQDFKLLRQRTVYENVAFALEVIGKGEKEIQEVVPYLLDQVGLLERSDAFPRELSTGEQQRVAIARALAHEPVVLLADEPTGNLDHHNTEQIVKLLRQINEWGTTVIMATHDDDLVHSQTGAVVEIRDGKLKTKR